MRPNRALTDEEEALASAAPLVDPEAA
jgi:hypothetical protein